jgi:hypothetical protein
MCVCVCVCIYICIYVYVYMIHIHICWGDLYGYIPLRSSHAGLKWHVTCCMLEILVYYRNKQASNVLLSLQFDTNVSQLLRHVLPWSYDPLPSLGELSSSSLNRLFVCLSCLFCLCIPPVVYGSPVLCLLCLRVALFSKGKKGFQTFKKKLAWRRAWREDDVRRQTSAPPHLTVWRQSWQLR